MIHFRIEVNFGSIYFHQMCEGALFLWHSMGTLTRLAVQKRLHRCLAAAVALARNSHSRASTIMPRPPSSSSSWKNFTNGFPALVALKCILELSLAALRTWRFCGNRNITFSRLRDKFSCPCLNVWTKVDSIGRQDDIPRRIQDILNAARQVFLSILVSTCNCRSKNWRGQDKFSYQIVLSIKTQQPDSLRYPSKHGPSFSFVASVRSRENSVPSSAADSQTSQEASRWTLCFY